MRHAAAMLFAACLAMLPAGATLHPSVTVVVNAEQPVPQSTFDALNRELSRLLDPAGLRVDVRLQSTLATGESFDDLVVVTLKGQCAVEQDPMLIDERGPAPLAYAHTSGTGILPFAVVSCDGVRRAVDAALWGGQHGERDALLGRALARVMAHEIFHVLGKTPSHGKAGLFSPKLTGAQLIARELDFAPADLDRLRHTIGRGR